MTSSLVRPNQIGPRRENALKPSLVSRPYSQLYQCCTLKSAFQRATLIKLGIGPGDEATKTCEVHKRVLSSSCFEIAMVSDDLDGDVIKEEDLLEKACVYLLEGCYHKGSKPNEKKVIRRRDAKFEVRLNGELWYNHR